MTTIQKTDAPDPRRWITLAIVLIGFMMILIDTTVVNVSIPTIINDLHASLSQIEWVISGYSLSFAALLITFGRLGDMYGRKRFFILGLALFGAASLLCGEASTPGTLIAARLVQGIGGAVISPTVLSIISSTFKGRERATAFGLFGAVTGVAVALGPVLGGYFTTYYTWRWIFRINIPIAVAGIILSMLYVQESKDTHRQKLDISGMVTSALASLFLVFGLIEGATYGWWHQVAGSTFSIGSLTWPTSAPLSVIPFMFILGVIFLALFLYIQSVKTRRNAGPAVDFNLMQLKSFRYGLIAIAVIALGEFSSLFTLPIFLQSVHGFTALQTGIGTLPLAFAAMVAAPTSAFLVNKIGSKRVVTTGITIEFLGLFLFSFLKYNSTYLSLVPAYVILGLGIGLAVAQNTQVTLSEVQPRQAGAASGVLNTIRQLGTAFGIAIVGAVLTSRLATTLPQQIDTVNNLPQSAKTAIINVANASGVSAEGTTPQISVSSTPPAAITNDPAALATYNQEQEQVGKDVQTAISKSLTQSIDAGIRTGALFVAIGALLSLLIPNIKHEKDPEDTVAMAGH